MSQDRIPLVQVPRRLPSECRGQSVNVYRDVYKLAVNGEVPAEWDGGRWYVSPSDLGVIAEKLKSRRR
jgi:hypothetical protein